MAGKNKKANKQTNEVNKAANPQPQQAQITKQ